MNSQASSVTQDLDLIQPQNLKQDVSFEKEQKDFDAKLPQPSEYKDIQARADIQKSYSCDSSKQLPVSYGPEQISDSLSQNDKKLELTYIQQMEIPPSIQQEQQQALESLAKELQQSQKQYQKTAESILDVQGRAKIASSLDAVFSSFTLVIHEAKNINIKDKKKLVDPYLRVFLNDKRKGRTRIIKQTTEPKWEQMFVIEYPRNPGKKNYLRLELCDGQQSFQQEQIGEVVVILDATAQNALSKGQYTITDWYLIGPPQTHKGSFICTGKLSLTLTFHQSSPPSPSKNLVQNAQQMECQHTEKLKKYKDYVLMARVMGIKGIKPMNLGYGIYVESRVGMFMGRTERYKNYEDSVNLPGVDLTFNSYLDIDMEEALNLSEKTSPLLAQFRERYWKQANTDQAFDEVRFILKRKYLYTKANHELLGVTSVPIDKIATIDSMEPYQENLDTNNPNTAGPQSNEANNQQTNQEVQGKKLEDTIQRDNESGILTENQNNQESKDQKKVDFGEESVPGHQAKSSLAENWNWRFEPLKLGTDVPDNLQKQSKQESNSSKSQINTPTQQIQTANKALHQDGKKDLNLRGSIDSRPDTPLPDFQQTNKVVSPRLERQRTRLIQNDQLEMEMTWNQDEVSESKLSMTENSDSEDDSKSSSEEPKSQADKGEEKIPNSLLNSENLQKIIEADNQERESYTGDLNKEFTIKSFSPQNLSEKINDAQQWQKAHPVGPPMQRYFFRQLKKTFKPSNKESKLPQKPLRQTKGVGSSLKVNVDGDYVQDDQLSTKKSGQMQFDKNGNIYTAPSPSFKMDRNQNKVDQSPFTSPTKEMRRDQTFKDNNSVPAQLDSNSQIGPDPFMDTKRIGEQNPMFEDQIGEQAFQKSFNQTQPVPVGFALVGQHQHGDFRVPVYKLKMDNGGKKNLPREIMVYVAVALINKKLLEDIQEPDQATESSESEIHGVSKDGDSKFDLDADQASDTNDENLEQVSAFEPRPVFDNLLSEEVLKSNIKFVRKIMTDDCEQGKQLNEEFWGNRKLTNMNVQPWVKGEDCLLKRSLTYQQPLNIPFMPKFTDVIEEDIIMQKNNKGFTLVHKTQTPRVPAGSCFYIWVQFNAWEIDVTSTQLQVSAKAEFIKSTMLKDQILNNAFKPLKESIVMYIGLLKKHLITIMAGSKEGLSKEDIIMGTNQITMENQKEIADLQNQISVVAQSSQAQGLQRYLNLFADGVKFIPDNFGNIQKVVTLILQMLLIAALWQYLKGDSKFLNYYQFVSQQNINRDRQIETLLNIIEQYVNKTQPQFMQQIENINNE